MQLLEKMPPSQKQKPLTTPILGNTPKTLHGICHKNLVHGMNHLNTKQALPTWQRLNILMLAPIMMMITHGIRRHGTTMSANPGINLSDRTNLANITDKAIVNGTQMTALSATLIPQVAHPANLRRLRFALFFLVIFSLDLLRSQTPSNYASSIVPSDQHQPEQAFEADLEMVCKLFYPISIVLIHCTERQPPVADRSGPDNPHPTLDV